MKTFGVQAQSTGSSWMARLGLLYCSIASLGLPSTVFAQAVAPGPVQPAAQPAAPPAEAPVEQPATPAPDGTSTVVPSPEQAAEATYDQPATTSYEGTTAEESSYDSYGGSSESSYEESDSPQEE